MLRHRSPDDPLFQRELIYARRRDGSQGAALRIVALACALVALLTWVALENLKVTYYSLILTAAEAVVWTFQGIVLLRTFAIGIDTITRDHVGQTWDLLALTPVGAARIFAAKWRAALYQSRAWLLALGLVRLAMLPCCVLVYTYWWCWDQLDAPLAKGWFFWGDALSMWLIPLALVSFTLILTILDVVYCAALGVMAGALTRRLPTAMLLAFCARFLPVIVVALLAMARGSITPTYWQVPWYWWITLFEGGSGALMRLPIPTSQFLTYAEDPQSMQWIGLIMAIVIFGICLSTAWRVGVRALREEGG